MYTRKRMRIKSTSHVTKTQQRVFTSPVKCMQSNEVNAEAERQTQNDRRIHEHITEEKRKRGGEGEVKGEEQI